MALTFQAGTTVIVSNGLTSRQLLVSSCSVSQTFLEEARAVKTLHSQNNIADTFSNSKSNVSLNFDFYLTPGDSLVLEWFGMTRSGNRYHFPLVGSVPTKYTVYVKTHTTIYQITDCILGNMVFGFEGRETALSVSASAQGGNLETIPALPLLVNTIQTRSEFLVGSLSAAGQSTLIAGLTLEAAKTVEWVQSKTLHKVFSGNIYTHDSATVRDIAIGGTLTRYKDSDILPAYSKTSTISISYAGKVLIHLDPCLRLARWDTSDVVHKVMQDFKLLPSGSSAYLEFIV